MAEQEITNEVKEELNPFDSSIEEQRIPLLKKYNSIRRISSILSFVAIGLCIGGMLLVSSQLAWLGWVLLGISLAGMLVFYFLIKKKFDASLKEYLAFIANALNKETFASEEFKEIEVTDNKVEVDDVKDNAVYTDIVRVASRNLVKGKYEDFDFKFAEIAIYKSNPNKKQQMMAAFVGKYFETANDLKFDGNYVINFAKEEPVDAPNGVEGKAKLYESNGLTVYGDEGAKFREVLGEQFFAAVKKIEPIDHLLNLSFSISMGRTFAFLSYDDDVIALPFDKEFNGEAFRSFVADLKNVFEAVKLLGK